MTLDDQQSEIVTFAVFFSVLVSILLITVGYSILRIYTSPKDIRRVQLLQRDIDANHLADNFLSQCQLLYSFPLPWKSSTPFMSKFTPSLPTTTTTATSGTNPTAMKSHSFVFSTWISWMALLCFAIALILIIVACALGNLETGAVLKQTKLMYPAVIMLVISSNVFLLTRQSVYYSQKLKESWFINDLDTYQDVQHHNNQFHSISIRPYSLPNRLHEMEKHRYSCRPWSFQNMAQCALLFIEFLQWISFPLLDLLTLKNLRMVHPLPISIMRMFTFMTDPINTQLLFKLQFWTSFVFMVVGVLVVWVFYIVNHKLKKGWSLGWIFFLLPLTSVMYLPYMLTFLPTLSCMARLTSSGDVRCVINAENEALYLVCAFIGFLGSYFLLTLFLSADERKPDPGSIMFKSSSVAFMKNMSFLIAFVSIFIPNSSPMLRGALYISIGTTMLAYNIHMQPCNVYQINFLRTTLLALLLFTMMFNLLAQDPQTILLVHEAYLWIELAAGYVMVIFQCALLYWLHWKEKGLKEAIVHIYKNRESVIVSPIETHFTEVHLRTGVKQDEI